LVSPAILSWERPPWGKLRGKGNDAEGKRGGDVVNTLISLLERRKRGVDVHFIDTGKKPPASRKGGGRV